ncbi:D-glycero-beta-D-manno-heptose 1-phosphate adenylyltransferase [Lachnospiraceae bacterium 48-21]
MAEMISNRLFSRRILVVGDFMVDSYFSGEVDRISPEAPVPVFHKQSQRYVLGGAANVVSNLIAAGQDAVACSVIGQDFAGETLLGLLNETGCDSSLVSMSPARMTGIKTRILAQNHQQLLRIDEERIEALKTEEEERLLENIMSGIESIDAIVLSDYSKGVLTETLCRELISYGSVRDIPVLVDVKERNTRKYAGAFLLKPNRKELADLTGMPVRSKPEITAAARCLLADCGCRFVLVTLGAKGMALVSRETADFIPCVGQEVFDVSGAGDTVIAYVAACAANGMEILEAARIANVAGGIKVSKAGTATVSLGEVERCLGMGQTAWKGRKGKVVTVPELMVELGRAHGEKREGKIVFTNGCFDILHAGHTMYLQKAAEYGDILIVGVNSDPSVKRLKGSARPVNKAEDRTAVLAALECVSYVVVFDEDTPENLIHAVKPDVLVKGGDYEDKAVAGADFVKENGGKVVLIPLLEGRSTTNMIDKVR